MTTNGSEVLRSELEAFDDEFRRAPGERKSFKPVPDGRYNAVIERLSLKRARSGSPFVEWVLRITEGDQAGERVWYRRTITANSLPWIKQDFAVCGLNVEKLSTVAERLPALVGTLIEFSLKTKGEHRNVYFNRRLSEQDDGDAANVIEAPEDEFPV